MESPPYAVAVGAGLGPVELHALREGGAKGHKGGMRHASIRRVCTAGGGANGCIEGISPPVPRELHALREGAGRLDRG